MGMVPVLLQATKELKSNYESKLNSLEQQIALLKIANAELQKLLMELISK
jgi:hypothetical protein